MTPRGRWHRLPRDPSTTRQLRTWARAMLTPGAAAVLDTETTGLGDDARIVDIGVVDAATGIVLLSTLVNPGRPIPAEATAVHHIADADVVDAPSWGQVLSDLEATLGFREIVAYHARFRPCSGRRRVRRSSPSIGGIAASGPVALSAGGQIDVVVDHPPVATDRPPSRRR